MNAVIYARFSSDRQTEMSIDAQVRACTDYALQNGITITGIYKDEAISGKSTINRAEYQKMLRHAQAHKFDAILIHKYDRIARNLGDHINLANKLNDLGISLIAVAQNFGEGKEAKLMKGIQWILSEYYIDNLAEEVRKGHKELAIKGLHNGGYAPFGYDIVDQKYVINPVEAEYVKRIFINASLLRGYNDILKEMQDAGITGKRGKLFSRSSITDILHNEKYTGVYIYSPIEEKSRSNRRAKPNAIRVDGAIPPIISKELFNEVQRIMETRKQNGKTKYRCSGLVYCECGAKMHINTAKRKGKVYSRYMCSKKCGAKTIRTEVVDNLVDIYLKELFSEENRKIITKEINDYVKNEEQMLKDFEETRKTKIAEKQTEIDNLLANMSKANISDDVMERINLHIQELLRDIEKYKTLQPVKSYTPKIVNGWLDSLLKANEEDLPQLFVEKIIIKAKEAEIVSTLASLCMEYGCGGTHPHRLHDLSWLPEILFHYFLQIN